MGYTCQEAVIGNYPCGYKTNCTCATLQYTVEASGGSPGYCQDCQKYFKSNLENLKGTVKKSIKLVYIYIF